MGSGMLTAAVAGNIFASPTVAAILAACRTVAGPPGVLLIVKVNARPMETGGVGAMAVLSVSLGCGLDPLCL